MSKFSRGVELFYPGMIWQSIENNRLNSGGGLAVKGVWGRRAEDPFRGLRAGPVRSSPHFCHTLLPFIAETMPPSIHPEKKHLTVAEVRVKPPHVPARPM